MHYIDIDIKEIRSRALDLVPGPHCGVLRYPVCQLDRAGSGIELLWGLILSHCRYLDQYINHTPLDSPRPDDPAVLVEYSTLGYDTLYYVQYITLLGLNIGILGNQPEQRCIFLII